MDMLYVRLLFIFADTICLFADNFAGLESIALRLFLWVEISCVSSLPLSLRLRLLIVVCEERDSATLRDEDFRLMVHLGVGKRLVENFSTIKIF